MRDSSRGSAITARSIGLAADHPSEEQPVKVNVMTIPKIRAGHDFVDGSFSAPRAAQVRPHLP